MEHMEHRWGERLKVELPVRIWTAYGVVGSGRVLDLSVSGAFIATELPVALLSPLNVIFQRPRSQLSSPSATYVAHVARKTARGIGIEWFDFASEDVIALTDRGRTPVMARAVAVAEVSVQERKLERWE